MHIPDHMLNGVICPVTAVVGIAGVASAAYFAVKSKEKPSALRFAAVASLIFASQMMNFPVQNGTSGHLLGTTLAISLLGVPFGILSMIMILAVQCVVFADGGLSVLGANILNMALAGAIPGIMLNYFLRKKPLLTNPQKGSLLFVASWLSVLFASTFCAFELGVSGTVSFSKVFPAMTQVHCLIGIFEAAITTALFFVLADTRSDKTSKSSILIPLFAAGIIGLILSPFASGYPDGLEWVAEKYAFFHQSLPYFVSPLSDYSVPFIKNEMFSTGLAGLAGVAITFIISILLGLLLNRKSFQD